MSQRSLGGHNPALGLVLLLTASFAACSTSSSEKDAGTASDAAADAPSPQLEDANEIPCAPRRVLQKVCQQCHTRPSTKNGAPFPLVTRSNVLATYSGTVIRELMIQQLETRRMPLAPVTITDPDRDTLLEWLRGGAPAVPAQECEESDAGDAGTEQG